MPDLTGVLFDWDQPISSRAARARPRAASPQLHAHPVGPPGRARACCAVVPDPGAGQPDLPVVARAARARRAMRSRTACFRAGMLWDRLATPAARAIVAGSPRIRGPLVRALERSPRR